jgi:hypothetical protein
MQRGGTAMQQSSLIFSVKDEAKATKAAAKKKHRWGKQVDFEFVNSDDERYSNY